MLGMLRRVDNSRVLQRIREKTSNLTSQDRFITTTSAIGMPSSKGEPTDPELREKIKEEVKAEEKGKFPVFFYLHV